LTSTLAPPATRAVPVQRARAEGRARLVTIAIAAGAVITLGMWLHHGGLSNLHGPGGLATGVGQLAALIGTYAVLVQLLLMSRIAWLENALGLDRLAVWHRWTGFAAVTLLGAHVVFTTVGWAAGAIPPVSVWHETGWLISHGPDILMAWAGFLLFLAIAFTSVRVARRKLTRETWYFIHLYAYLAVALTFAHQLAMGSDFTADTLARAWWIALYVVVFGAIIWWRVVEPMRTNAVHQMRVHSVQREAPGVVSIWIRGKSLDRMGAQPGQFFIWRFLTKHDWWHAHPFSLSAAPRPDLMRITVKDLGDGSKSLQDLRVGTRVFVEGPYGTFTAARRTRPGVLLIAGGIGITPLRAVLDSFRPGDDVVLCYRVASEDEVLFRDELDHLAKKRGVTVHVVPGTDIGNDQTDKLGVPALRHNVPDIARRDCYVCGPPGLIEAVRRRLRKLRVPESQIHYERFEF
jgi:predicted ferric reductase